MHGRHLLESESYIYIPIGSIICITVALFWGLCKCYSSRRNAAAAAAAAEQTTQYSPQDIEARPSAAPSATTSYPQFVSSNSYSPGVINVPAHVPVDFSNYEPARNPFTRAQIQSMNVDELKQLKEKLNMG
jgi:hypothetical protein